MTTGSGGPCTSGCRKRLHDLVVEAPHGSGSRLLDEDVERARDEHVRPRAEAELERFRAARTPDAGGPGRGRRGGARAGRGGA